jgi:iron complex outermembrane receptor protein
VQAEQVALDEVIVTAQRRSERAQDVPIAISALSSLDLEARGVRQAGDIAASVPNLMLSSPYGEEAQPTFSLRGVTTNDWSQNQSSPIAMYVDDVYKSVGAVQALQTYDLDRVEVLRGPQGTLYGKNATGGALNFYSRNPSLTESDGYLTVGLGNYSSRTVTAAAGVPVIDDVLGVRAAVFYEKRDGWVRSVVPGVEALNSVDAVSGRISALLKPSNTFTALLKAYVTDSGGTPYGAHALNNNPDVTGFSGDYGWFGSGAKYAIHKKLRSAGTSLKLDWQLSDHYTLTSVTGFDYGLWFEKSDDGALATTDAGVAIHLDDPNTYSSSVNAFSQEIRISGHDLGSFGWLGGIFYGRDSTHASETFHFFDSSCLGCFVTGDGTPLWGFDEFNSFDQVRESKALFLNATYTITPKVTLRAGVRYTRDDITISNFYALEGGLVDFPSGLGADTVQTLWTQTIPYEEAISYINYIPGTAVQGTVTPRFKDAHNNVSVKVGVDWRLADDVLSYLSFSQGYRGAAFNGQAFNSPVELTFAKPEKLDALEAGVKSTLMDKRLELNAATFYYRYHDQQFLDTYCAFPTDGGCAGTGFVTSNAPRSRIVGAEAEVRARPTPNLDLRANIGVLDSKYQELYLHFANRSGNKLIMAPDFSGGVSADWCAARFSAGDLHFEVDANYYGKQYYDALNTERIAQPGYSIVNARISLLGNSNQHFSAALWGKNLTNRQYLAYGLAQRNAEDGGLGFDYVLVGEPRMYGAELTYRF